MDEASKWQIDAAYAFNEIVTNSGKTHIFGDPWAQKTLLNILERHFDSGDRLDLAPFEDVRGLLDWYEDMRVDPVMRIPNRRAFEVELLRKWARFVREPRKNSFTLVMIDIDNFKFLNDRYGHPAGDQVLRMIADAFKNHLRTGDLVSRWGGDELAVIIENDQADKAGGQIGNSVWESKLNLVNQEINQLMSEKGWQWPGLEVGGQMTHFSYGLHGVTADDKNLDPQKLVELVDEKTYRCKRERNVGRGLGLETSSARD